MFRPLLAASFALALTACVDNNADSGLTILRNLAPATGCVVSPDSLDFRPSGVIQSDAVRGYLLTPIARNDLTVADGESISQKTIFVEGAHVTIDFYDDALYTEGERTAFAADGLTRFAVPTSGAVDPDGGTATFGFEVVPAELLAMLDTKLGAASASTLLDVTVQIYGSRAGSSIESNVFRYPVEVCTDCVRSNVGDCASLPMGFMGGIGGACNLLQDGVLQCCNGAGGEVCPAASSTPET